MRPTSTSRRPRGNAPWGCPNRPMATVFEVVTDGKVYRVKGEALQRWIVERRQKGQGTWTVRSTRSVPESWRLIILIFDEAGLCNEI